MNAPTRIVPAKGIQISDAGCEELTEGAAALLESIAELQLEPEARELLPDVEIFYNAVQYAIEQDIFYEEEDVVNGMKLLAEGEDRAKGLMAGGAPWTVETGLTVRGYRSRLDDSVQPYGLVVPDSYDSDPETPHRLDIWHHGRNAKGSELRFLVERMNKPGQFTPDATFVLHTYGRYCNAMKFAGEVDTFESLAHAKANYPIDDDRVCMRGFSMGGAAVWHQASHMPGEWVAATPGAGFAETAIYQNIADREVQPPWWEQKLWGLYDATKVAGNLRHCPTIAYSGENDKQVQSSDIMAEHMAKEGLELTHIIGPGMGHAFDDGSKDEIERQLKPIVEKGRDLTPRSIEFATYTLRYNRIGWVRIDGLEHHWERAEVRADVVDDCRITVETENISALTLEFLAGHSLLDPGSDVQLEINGTRLSGGTVSHDGQWSVSLLSAGGKWSVDVAEGLRKVHGVQGPIDDAFMDSFVMVTPTGSPMMGDGVTEWLRDEQRDAAYQWAMQFRGEPRVRSDNQVSDQNHQDHNLILWGDPGSNAILGKIADALPIQWDRESIRVADIAYSSDKHVPVLIYPNPINPQRYVVVNSGFTFAQNGSMSNATQTPKLPDWAILDIGVPAADRILSGVVDCDFFDEEWKLTAK